MSEIEKLREILVDRNVQAVARESKVSASTIYRIKRDDCNPKHNTVTRLLKYFRMTGEKVNG